MLIYIKSLWQIKQFNKNQIKKITKNMSTKIDNIIHKSKYP